MGLGKDRNMSKQESETPRFIAALADQKIRKVAAGANFSMFLTEEGKVFTCGKSDYGAVGSPERYIHQPSIVPMLRNKTIVDIAAGLYHAAVCTDDGSMYTFGLNKDGQLGIDTISVFNPVPQKVHLLEREIVKVAAGGGHTACLTADGALYIWGRGRDGQMGRADHLESIAAVRTLPVELDAFQGVTDVQLGGDFSIVVANKKL
jgi:alpha-tubulin suppressor-like RCC1 family protein